MVRAGAHALTLLSVPLNVQVLTALEDGPMALADLRRATGSPPRTTTRTQLRLLTDLGILERRRESEFPGSAEYRLGGPGVELLEVVKAAGSWLELAPHGPLRFGTLDAKNSLRALIDGWTSTMIRALATRDLTLTELDRVIPDLNYPSLERRLSAMRSVGLVHTRRAQGRGSACVVDDWLRRAAGPLAAAARWERRAPVPGEVRHLTPLDIEAMILLSVPSLSLPADLSGTIRLAVELSRGSDPEIAGALVEVSDGCVVSCRTKSKVDATSWASGSVAGWFAAILDGQIAQLEVGGEASLAKALLEGLHRLMTPGSVPAMD
jgi:DNA-binding HxlR family transcriptional regulator